jgi:uncharacterized MAPEG superfamily protein
MIIAFWCVLVAGILPIVCSYLAKFGSSAAPEGGSTGRFDNRDPRGWLARQGGPRARANAAQQNSFEAFPFFAIGVVIAVLQHVPVATIDVLAVVFIVARLLYIGFYVGNLASLRSLAWLVGFVASVALYLYAATGTLR